jgi:hypothetical protein
MFVYTVASEYSVGLPDDKKWLSKGIKEIRTVLGFPGEMLPSRKCHLIVLVGYEAERVRELVENYEPSILSLGMGDEDSSLSIEHHRLNRLVHTVLTERFTRYNEFLFSPSNPFHVSMTLRSVVKSTDNVNVVVAAMNTKLSTVGAALVAIKDESIQLCYATAMQYNTEKDSVPSEYCYVVRDVIARSIGKSLR